LFKNIRLGQQINENLVQVPSIMKVVRKEVNCKSSDKCNTKWLEK